MKSLLESKKYAVRVLANLCASDQRTVMGSSLSQIARECGFLKWEPSKLNSSSIKKKMKYSRVPAEETWRLGLLSELLCPNLELPGFNDDELVEMISFACKS